MDCGEGNGSDAARRTIGAGRESRARQRLESASPSTPKGAEKGTEAADPGIETLVSRAATAWRGAAHDAHSREGAFEVRALAKERNRSLAPSQKSAAKVSRARDRPNGMTLETRTRAGSSHKRRNTHKRAIERRLEPARALNSPVPSIDIAGRNTRRSS